MTFDTLSAISGGHDEDLFCACETMLSFAAVVASEPAVVLFSSASTDG